MHGRLFRQPGGKVDRLAHGHLLRRRDEHRPGPHRVTEDLQYPFRLRADDTHPDELVDAGGGGELADHVARRGSVDHDQVVAVGPDLKAQLADCQDLPYPRRRRRHEVECPGDRADVPDGRHLGEDPQVLSQRRLGVHRHRHEVVADAPAGEAGRSAFVGAGKVSLRLGLADKGASTLLAREQGDRCGNGGLADAALTGDEEQPVSEELGHRAQASVGPEADAAVLAAAADLDVGDLGRRHGHVTAPLVGEPEHSVRLAKGLLDAGRDDVGVRRPLGEIDVELSH